MDFVLELSNTSPKGKELFRALKEKILKGSIPYGTKLPATRALAAQLCVGRNLVIETYSLLMEEGLVESLRGTGTFVIYKPLRSEVRQQQSLISLENLFSNWANNLRDEIFIDPPLIGGMDFRPGVPDHRNIIQGSWRGSRISNIKDLHFMLAGYGQAEGMPELREEISRYVGVSRGVLTTKEQVFITSGAQQGFDLIARIFIEPGTKVVIENPGYPPLRSVLRSVNADIHLVNVDEDGLRVSEIPAGTRIVFCTPGHQMPLGCTLSTLRRKELLEWAENNNGLIIEDDYDCEYRHSGAPISALTSKDVSGRVVLIGSFSKLLFPSVRLGFLVVPQWLSEKTRQGLWVQHRQPSGLSQFFVEEFMRSGAFAAHMQRMKRIYQRRRRLLLDLIAGYIPDKLEILNSNYGLHFSAYLTNSNISPDDVHVRMAQEGVGVYPLRAFYVSGPKHGFIFGFARVQEDKIEEAIWKLATVLERR